MVPWAGLSYRASPDSNLTSLILLPGGRDLWPRAAAGAVHSFHRSPQSGTAPHVHTPNPSHPILLPPDPFADSQEALRTRGFLELSAAALLPLLRSDELRVDEVELVRAARSWARVGAVSRGGRSARALMAAPAAGSRQAGGGEVLRPARAQAGLAFAGGAGEAGGRGGGPGGPRAETGLAGPGGAERLGRAEPAGAAHPGEDAGNQAKGSWRARSGSGSSGKGALRDSAVTGLLFQVEQIVEAWKCHALRRGDAAQGAPYRRRRGTLPREHHRFLDLPFK